MKRKRQRTLDAVFAHPTSASIAWRDIEALLREYGAEISEREGSENNPEWTLYEEVAAAAYRVHPYGHMVIGWKEDLRNLSRDDLYQHYKTYYGPHNAVLIIAGDINVDQVRARIDTLFGPISGGPPPPAGLTCEFLTRFGTIPDPEFLTIRRAT